MTWRFVPVSQFAEVTSVWDLLHRKVGSTPLLDAAFFGPLIDEFATGQELIAIHEPDPVAIGIFTRKNILGWQTFQPANAPLGAWMMEPAANIGTLLQSLRSALPGAALLIGLSQLDPDILPRPAASKNLSTLDYIRTARIDIAGNYAEYWASRSKNLRRNMVRQRNRLEREGRAVRLEILTEPAQMTSAVADYARLESSGWKEAAATAVHADDPQGRFYTKMLGDFAARGEALVLRYFYDEQLVACDLCLLRNKALIILKTTHDEGQRGTAPAHLMRHEIIRSAFETGDIDRIEFYGPAQDWHLRWTEDVRVIYHVNYYRSAMVARLHGWARKPPNS